MQKTNKRTLKGGSKGRPPGKPPGGEPPKSKFTLSKITQEYFNSAAKAKQEKSKINSLWHRLTRSRKNRGGSKVYINNNMKSKRDELQISGPVAVYKTLGNSNKLLGESGTNMTNKNIADQERIRKLN